MRDSTTSQNIADTPNRASPPHRRGSRAARPTVLTGAATCWAPIRPTRFMADLRVSWPATANPTLTTSRARETRDTPRAAGAAEGRTSGGGASKATRPESSGRSAARPRPGASVCRIPRACKISCTEAFRVDSMPLGGNFFTKNRSLRGISQRRRRDPLGSGAVDLDASQSAPGHRPALEDGGGAISLQDHAGERRSAIRGEASGAPVAVVDRAPEGDNAGAPADRPSTRVQRALLEALH